MDDQEEDDDEDIILPAPSTPPTAKPPIRTKTPPKPLLPTMSKMHTVFGDHPRLDMEEDQSGGVEENEVLQKRWHQLIVLTSRYYHLPSGQEGKRFSNLLAHEVDLIVE